VSGIPADPHAAHHHHHGLPRGVGPLVTVLGLTGGVMVVEVVGGLLSGSLALLADAGHMLTDVAGLTLAVAAGCLSKRPATAERTWGLRRAEVLAAAAQAAVLLTVGVLVLVEALRRIADPPEVSSGTMLVFGGVGLLANLAGLAVLAGTRDRDLNTRAAFLEVLNDAAGSLAVLVAAGATALGARRADVLVSLLIGGFILPRSWALLRRTVDILLESAPRGTDMQRVREHLMDMPRVLDVHDLHASLVSSDLPVLTAHVVVEDACFHDGCLPELLDRIQACLREDHGLEHTTVQFEPAAHAAHEPVRHE